MHGCAWRQVSIGTNCVSKNCLNSFISPTFVGASYVPSLCWVLDSNKIILFCTYVCFILGIGADHTILERHKRVIDTANYLLSPCHGPSSPDGHDLCFQGVHGLVEEVHMHTKSNNKIIVARTDCLRRKVESCERWQKEREGDSKRTTCNTGARLPRFESQLYYLLALWLWLWANYWTSLRLSYWSKNYSCSEKLTELIFVMCL
jgi:hypothetical protein